MIFSILWVMQTLLFIYLIYDLHARLNQQRRFIVALCVKLDIPVQKVFDIIDGVEDWQHSQNK